MSILGFILYLIVAAVCAAIADRLVPGRVPGGFFTCAVFGILGAWIGGSLMGSIGPSLGGISILPAIVGSGLFIFLFSMLSGRVKAS